MRWALRIDVRGRELAIDKSTYFIADISDGFGGDVSRARALIDMARSAGADAVSIRLGERPGDQPVGAVLDDGVAATACAMSSDTTLGVVQACADAGLDCIPSPDSLRGVDMVGDQAAGFAIGSGDITWTGLIRNAAGHDKPVFVATGGASMPEVMRAVDAALAVNPQVCLMQSNAIGRGWTSAGASQGGSAAEGPLAHNNLRVLQTYAMKYPGMVLGLHDVMPGHAAVLGAVALGARVIVKPLADEMACSVARSPLDATVDPVRNAAVGPEALPSADDWREMVQQTRDLEAALGDGFKRVEAEDMDAVRSTRRCLRLTRNVPAGHVLCADDVEAVRPCPDGAVEPFDLDAVIGRPVYGARRAGEALMYGDVDLVSGAQRAWGG